VGESRIDLVVEDTGDPDQLAHRLAELGGMPVVHLSCHGLNNWRDRPGAPGVPVLLMEDDIGEGRPVTAAELASLLTVGPRLLFVSACLTATEADASGHLPPGRDRTGKPGTGTGGGGLVAQSMATALVAAGIPAVIGWEGSVGDRSATAFAERLYRGLADRANLATAVGDARRVLLGSQDELVRADWHLARLWLGPAGGGPLVAGGGKRSLVTATHGTKTFLDRKQQVPVAAAKMFVGRRPELQQALRALRSGQRAGVLLHGQGRLGKSSLAARIADRCPDLAAAVVFGDYGRWPSWTRYRRRCGRTRLPGSWSNPGWARCGSGRRRSRLCWSTCWPGRVPRPGTAASGRGCWSLMTWSGFWWLTRPGRTG
jgi:hypothetical protein